MKTTWRWTEYCTGIFQLAMLAAGLIFIDESYAPVLLVQKSRRLRHETGNWALHSAFEEWDVSVKELAHKFLIRPFQLIMTPICFLMALYASFCYGILYLQLGMYNPMPHIVAPLTSRHRRHSDHFPADTRLEYSGWGFTLSRNASRHVYRKRTQYHEPKVV